MIAKLHFARLVYGSSIYPVEPADHLPIPAEFDFDNAEECARKVLACLSNAAGGFAISNCKLHINPVRRIANITGRGAHAYYAPDKLPKLSLKAALEAAERTATIELGEVSTDQYGDGWQRAKWIQPAAH